VTVIQGVITAYTLVMAATMITGAKVGDLLGRRRALRIGLVVYACGSGLTAVSPNVTVLLLGWSILEGLGAALIMPTLVALVAGNFVGRQRAVAYSMLAAAAAIAIAAGPIIGGFVSAYFSWRWVFAAEVLIAGGILLASKVVRDVRPRRSHGSISWALSFRPRASGCSCSAFCSRAAGGGWRPRSPAQIARVLGRSHCGGASASRDTFAFRGGVVLDLPVGGRFWIRLFAFIVGIGIATVILFAVIGAALVAWGVLGAFIFFGGLMLGFAWVYDRRDLRAHEQAVAQDAEHGDR
jgi:MFS family permease